MNEERDSDPAGAPDTANHPRGRRKPVPSLPGPNPASGRPALAAPSPTVDPPSARIPTAEVTLSPSHVYVTVELPGAPKDALDIQATEASLTIDAKRVQGPAYHLELALPASVKPGSAKATYLNGILDVTLTRARRSGGDRHGA